MSGRRRLLFRIIVPAYPKLNVYTSATDRMTALGPLCIATVAAKLPNWDAELIDENNCGSRFCPKAPDGYPDHRALQAARPAAVVGFYGSMSSSVPRLYRLAQAYKEYGATTVAGGKHIEFLPEEALANGVDIAVLGEGEETIREILLDREAALGGGPKRGGLERIAGIAYLRDGQAARTARRPLNTDLDSLPFPDFGLLLYGRINVYPINRTRGCDMGCEFCTVKDKTRTASPQWLAAQVIRLAETRGARKFFETSDHFAADRAEAIEFCKLMADYQERSGIRLSFIVQTRLTDARYPDLLAAMKAANVQMIAIGYESPIDEELLSMRKGYLSKDMVSWSRTFRDYGFFIHGMMIFGYPLTPEHRTALSAPDRMRRFKAFIRAAKMDTAQVLLAVPFAGTDLRSRLERDGRMFPLSRIGWEYYDGQFPLFEPDDGSTPEENMRAVTAIMGRFYSARYLAAAAASIVFQFPRMVVGPALSLITFRTTYLASAFRRWRHDYFRNYLLRIGGSFIVRKWKRNMKRDGFLNTLREVRRGPAPIGSPGMR